MFAHPLSASVANPNKTGISHAAAEVSRLVDNSLNKIRFCIFSTFLPAGTISVYGAGCA
ncbi:hypothetical protein SFMTTN_0426 [Sulfuriferula multivorans]|uniref:Uncharacterized protein n=1 Tax=Sulfuriferula multivorans TaxID=1559896 RepID=A0A401JAP0_9PROT|nr:hypothetical protein SFMTTN_0426 [Sulfuriferula multivorans]